MARNEESSSATKPCGHHTLAVLAAALATWGRAKVAAAARATDPRTTERLLSLCMLFLQLFPRPRERVAGRFLVGCQSSAAQGCLRYEPGAMARTHADDATPTCVFCNGSMQEV